MPDDYFEDSPGQDSPMPKDGGDGGDAADRSEGGETFLVNKSAYPDAKPGDMFKMRVEQVHDDEMECSVMKDDGEQEEGGEPPPEEAPMPAMAGGGNPMMD